MKSGLKNYFDISKKEWNGMLVLLVIMVLIWGSSYTIGYFRKEKVMDLTEFNKDIALIKAAKRIDTAYTTDYDDTDPDWNMKNEKAQLFVFNPNKLPDSLWLKLGLSKKQIHSIKNYENKGGRFATKADVKKMYALTAADYKRLEPYINIPPDEFKGKVADIIVEINTADSVKLTQIKGIGASFAQRIIKYRKDLGGFVNKQQLMEVYGIDTVKYHAIEKNITVNSRRINKIAINKVTIEELRPFPYLNFKQMNAILQYRTQHGNYTSMEDVQNVAILNEEILRKIAPYLKFK
ncbi:helix-hairpin-helix domain-containing protein [Mucilaginibacter sp. HMF5004]|uniref:helix-hairpin-helix domain-containing protein n=1 Tax=Mucilaginibacter rivuli TaxID=2857527 RepID=UPI001C5F56AD|nr:helix-hairpin-helix domain-containing protein [Mucilaginibacter rivuli]MBW4890866.1 helix-hairpin-helix domain-containing protein [Mucilaginibacter rivuli]